MRNRFLHAVLVLAILILAAPFAARAQETQPGDACTVAGRFMHVGGPENPGAGLLLVCDGSNWRRVAEWDNSANLGVKQAAPKAPLHVGGEAIIGPTTGLACDANRTGGLRWSSANSTFEMCDGSAWKKIAASACDNAPAFPIFTDQTMLATSTLVSSNIVSITGMDAGCNSTVSVSGQGSPEYRICTDSSCLVVLQNWTAGNTTQDMQGKYLQLRATTSASAGTTFTVTATIGATSANWNITTQYADCSGNPIGTVCGDGTVYAGTSPDGSVPMFTTRCDAGMSWTGSCTGTRGTYSWNAGNSSNLVDTLITNCASAPACDASGESSTAILINTDSDSGTAGIQAHAAAQYCADLNINGYTDWFLPSIREVDVMYANKTAIGNFNTSAGDYWGSSETTSSPPQAWIEDFSAGAISGGSKNVTSGRYVRCVRRNADITPASLSFTDQTNQAAAALITSNIIQITGMDTATSVAIINKSADGTGNPGYRICSDSSCSGVVTGWNSNRNSISNNQYVQLRMNANSTPGAINSALVIVGDLSDQWDLTTSSSDPCAGSPNPGAVCADGSVYAGLSPDGNTDMYTTRCDGGQTFSSGACTGANQVSAWNDGYNGTTNFVDTVLPNCTVTSGCTASGESNASILVNTDSNYDSAGQQQHAAAQYCADLSIHGQTDWYLPAVPEIDVMYANKTVIGNLSGTYWSSSEYNFERAWYMDINTGGWSNTQGGWGKEEGGKKPRCVRRNVDITPAAFSFTDQTNQTAAALINSNIVQITGLGAATQMAVTNKSGDGTGNPEYRICSDSSCSVVVTGWNSGQSAISNNQYVQLRMYANGAASGVNSVVVIVGDLTDQWDLTTASGDPCAGSPSPGAVCSDGSVYAGLTPDGNVAMYVTRCDVGQSWSGSACTGTRVTKAWNAGNSSNMTDTTLGNCGSAPACAVSGETNTTALIAEDSDSATAGTQLHIAAQHCADLSENGQTDWYLPSAPELNVMYTNKAATGQFDTSGSYYWSSSENSGSYPWMQRFSDGNQAITGKATGNLVRCARK